MMTIQFKQKCSRCKKNFVLTTSRQSYVLCYDCQKGALEAKITDPYFKELLDIPEEYYKETAFLRNIKVNYLKYKSLTANQVLAFKKVVQQMKKKSRE